MGLGVVGALVGMVIMPWPVTSGGPSPLGLSFLRGFYSGWKGNEWANRFSFRLCQVLPPLLCRALLLLWKS